MAHTPNQIRLVLASGSPRRRELLERVGLTFEVISPDLDEAVQPGEGARAYVERLAQQKAAAVARGRPEALVLAADTSVVLDGEILGKPDDDAHARGMVSRLAGRAHLVLTAVATAGPRAASLVVETTVRFRALTPAEIRWYVSTGEGRDKAGAYALQGIGAALVEKIEGSPTNVIGLPLVEALALLTAAGLTPPWET